MQSTTQDAITIDVNGTATLVTATSQTGLSLADLIAQLEIGDAKCATAVNGDFVPAGNRSTADLKDGDKVEILTARQGG